MRLWQDGIIALLAAIGLAAILWTLARTLLFLPPMRRSVVVLVSARGDGGDLEQQIRALSMRCDRNIVGEILLVDCGLSEEGQRICRLLARSNRRVTLCKAGEIEKYIS